MYIGVRGLPVPILYITINRRLTRLRIYIGVRELPVELLTRG